MSGTPNGARPLAVVMSVFNDAPYLRQAVDSVLGQSFGDFTFHIADDGSTDGSGDILAAYAAQDSRIRLQRNSNRGIVDSVNALLAEVEAPLIARMDGDDVSLPMRFEKQVAYLRDHPDVGAVGTQIRNIDPQGRMMEEPDPLPNDVTSVGYAFAAGRMAVANPTTMFRTALAQQIGGYRRAYRYCEDYDFFLRLLRHAQVANVPEALVLYRRSPSQVSHVHHVTQKIGSAIAVTADTEVRAGRPDPTEGLDQLPGLKGIPDLFPDPDVHNRLMHQLASELRFSPDAISGEEFAYIRSLIADQGFSSLGFKTVLRALRFGMPQRAIQIASAMLIGL